MPVFHAGENGVHVPARLRRRPRGRAELFAPRPIVSELNERRGQSGRIAGRDRQA